MVKEVILPYVLCHSYSYLNELHEIDIADTSGARPNMDILLSQLDGCSANPHKHNDTPIKWFIYACVQCAYTLY